MHALVLHVPLGLNHPAYRATFRASVWNNRQLCYSGPTIATTCNQQQHVAGDTVSSELVVDPTQQPVWLEEAGRNRHGTACNASWECSVAGQQADSITADSGAGSLLGTQLSHGNAVATSSLAVAASPSVCRQEANLADTHGQEALADGSEHNTHGHLAVEPQQLHEHETAPPTALAAIQSCQQLGAAADQPQQQPGVLLQQDSPEQLPRADSLEYQKSICCSLRSGSCCSIEQLASIVAEHGSSMDGQSIAASFTAASRLHKQQLQLQQPHTANSQGPQQQVLLLVQQQLMPLLRRKLRLLDATGLQMVLYALASLQYKEELAVLELEVSITPVVGQLAPGRVCQLVWALGQLDLKPQRQLLQQVLRISFKSMSFLHGQDLCQILQGLVQLQVQLPGVWLDMCCARVLQLCVHQQLELRALCSVFHSLARLVVVQQQQQQRLQQEEQQQPQLHPRRQATATLPQPLLQRLLDATQQALLHTAASPWQQVAEQQCPPQGDPQLLQQQQQLSQHPLPLQGHMSNCIQQQGDQQCLQGSLQTGQAAQQQHLRRAGQQQHAAEQDQWQCSEGLSPAGLNTFADALRLLRTDPPAEWQAAYIAAAQQLMHCGDARNVPLMLAPLVRWRNPPQQSWLQQYMAACQSLMPSMQAQGLAVLGHSLAAFHVRPSTAWLVAYLSAADSSRLAATPAGCSYLMHMLGSWRQLGCLPQQVSSPEATAPTAAVAQPSAPAAAVTAVGGWCSSDPADASSPVADGSAEAAAAAQQLQPMAHQLARQCLQCFVSHGDSFTAEQLGMFCKGLAMWGTPGTPQLASKLQQVLLQRLGHTIGQQGPRERFTATTLCSVLLALTVACRAAATPAVLTSLWATWSAWLLPSTTPAHAAAVAWAVGGLGVQLPQDFVTGLLQQLTVAVGEAPLQHVAAVLLQAKRGHWAVQEQQVVLLLQHMLLRQAAELSTLQSPWQPAEQQQEQQQQHRSGANRAVELQHSQAFPELAACVSGRTEWGGGAAVGMGKGMNTAHTSKDNVRSSSSSPAGARLFGLANHRLKSWVSVAAAVAAWCDALPVQQLRMAVRLFCCMVEGLPAEQSQALQAHVQVLAASCKMRGVVQRAAAYSELSVLAPEDSTRPPRTLSDLHAVAGPAS